jgi:hypothetical protein
MTNEVHKVTIQIRPPRGNNDGGEVAIGHYVVVDGYLVMTDQEGRPVNSEKHTLTPGEDVRLKACRLVRRRRTGPRGFNDKLVYPKLKY